MVALRKTGRCKASPASVSLSGTTEQGERLWVNVAREGESSSLEARECESGLLGGDSCCWGSPKLQGR